jgi:hypothetical protein
MRRADLVSDCRSCAGVCCVATSFDASEDFAVDKPAGVPCRYLTRDCRCAIHGELAERGFRGCAIYDCHGAGQRATRDFPAGPARDEAFLRLRVVHELLWLLTGALAICPAPEAELAAQLARQIERLDALEIEADVRAHREASHALLRRVGAVLGSRRARSLAVMR